MNEYKIGDIANGYILTEDGWVLHAGATETPKKSHTGLKVAGGIVAGLFALTAIGATAGGESATTATPKPAVTAEATPTPTGTIEKTPEPVTYSAKEAWAGMDKTTQSLICDEQGSARVDEFNDWAEIDLDIADADYSKKQVANATDGDCDTPTVPVKLTRADHKNVGERELSKIIKNPDAHVGENIIVYAEVTQFDSATGTDTFRGDVANRNITEYGYWIGGDNAIFTGTEKRLSDVVEDDVVKVWVTVTGSFSYDTQIGGNTTVPLFLVNFITVV